MELHAPAHARHARAGLTRFTTGTKAGRHAGFPARGCLAAGAGMPRSGLLPGPSIREPVMYPPGYLRKRSYSGYCRPHVNTPVRRRHPADQTRYVFTTGPERPSGHIGVIGRRQLPAWQERDAHRIGRAARRASSRITLSDWRWSSPGVICRGHAGSAHRLGAVSSQVMGQGLGDVPVVPELRFAPRLTRPRIPGCAARGGATDPDLPLWCPCFHRQMCRRSARADVGDCLHESTPPSRSGRARRSFFPIGRLQTIARHNEPCFYAGWTTVGLPTGLAAATAFVTRCGPPRVRQPDFFARTGARHAPAPHLSQACRGACHPQIPHHPGIDHPQGGITPTRRARRIRPEPSACAAAASRRPGRSAGRRRHPRPGEPRRFGAIGTTPLAGFAHVDGAPSRSWLVRREHLPEGWPADGGGR